MNLLAVPVGCSNDTALSAEKVVLKAQLDAVVAMANEWKDSEQKSRVEPVIQNVLLWAKF